MAGAEEETSERRSASAEEETSERRFASYEEHTRGFGSKMLALMGFDPGKGRLGKRESGIKEPIQVICKRQREGLSTVEEIQAVQAAQAARDKLLNEEVRPSEDIYTKRRQGLVAAHSAPAVRIHSVARWPPPFTCARAVRDGPRRPHARGRARRVGRVAGLSVMYSVSTLRVPREYPVSTPRRVGRRAGLSVMYPASTP